MVVVGSSAGMVDVLLERTDDDGCWWLWLLVLLAWSTCSHSSWRNSEHGSSCWVSTAIVLTSQLTAMSRSLSLTMLLSNHFYNHYFQFPFERHSFHSYSTLVTTEPLVTTVVGLCSPDALLSQFCAESVGLCCMRGTPVNCLAERQKLSFVISVFVSSEHFWDSNISQYGDGAGNTVEQSSSVFSLIQMR